MAWSVLQSNGAASGSGGNTCQYTSNVQSGTKLICAVTAYIHTVTAVKDGAGNSLTQIDTIGFDNSAGNGTVSLWAMDTPAGDAGTRPTLTATTSATYLSIFIQEVSGLAAGNTLAAMIDGTAGTSYGVSGASIACGAYSSSAASEYLAALFGDDCGSETPTVTGPPTGSTTYTRDTNSQDQANSDECLSFAYGNSTHGAETATFPVSSNTGNNWATIFVAFKLAAAASVTPFFPAGQPARSRVLAPYTLGRPGLLYSDSVQQVP